MTITTAFPTSSKQELAQGLHNYTYSTGITGTTANASNHITSMTSFLTTNLSVGMGVSDGGVHIPAGSYIGYIDSATSCYMVTATGTAANATGTNTGLTFSGDDFKMALMIATVAGTYGAATTNYTNVTGNSDEVANGGGYTTGGYDFTAANNITPQTSGTTAFWSWNVNPSWTTATFSTSGCLIYNASKNTRAVYVGSFGGTQTVTSGTLTVLLPTNNSSNAILRIQ